MNKEVIISNLIFLLIGWFLGLMGTIFIDYLKKLTQKKEIRIGIINEIKETRKNLVSMVMLMTLKYGNYNRETINWLEKHVDDFKNYDPDGKFGEMISKHKNITQDELQSFKRVFKNQHPDTLNLKSINMPFLESKISLLQLYKSEFQNFILNLRTQLIQLNEEITQAKFFYEKTFDSTLSTENYKIIQTNLFNSYDFIGNKSKQIVDLIESNL